MKFINNAEEAAFHKSGWCLIEESADGSVTYMGKPNRPDAEVFDRAWFIKRITVDVSQDGVTRTIIQVAEGDFNNAWDEKENCKYQF